MTSAVTARQPPLASLDRVLSLVAEVQAQDDPARVAAMTAEALAHLGSPRRWLMHQRLRGVARLRDDGATYTEIGDLLGVTQGRAQQLIEAARARGLLDDAPRRAPDVVAGDPVLLTTPEAAQILRVSARTLRRWRDEGRGDGPPYLRLGRKIVYDRKALSTWLGRSVPHGR